MPPNGILMMLVSSGRLFVLRVCRPGPKTSNALPSRKKTAAWPSRTMSCDPNLNSPAPCRGTRKTISSERSLGCWITSMRAMPLSLPQAPEFRLGSRREARRASRAKRLLERIELVLDVRFGFQGLELRFETVFTDLQRGCRVGLFATNLPLHAIQIG